MMFLDIGRGDWDRLAVSRLVATKALPWRGLFARGPEV